MKPTVVIALLATALPALAQPAASSAPAPTGVRRIDVDEGMQLALEQSPGLRAANLRRDAAQSGADSVRGRFLPSIHVSDEQQHYNGPFAITFPIELPSAPGVPSEPLGFVARNVNTNTFVAAVGQPLLGLLHLTQDHAALLAGADAAGEGARSLEGVIREAVQTGYLRYFEAKATGDIARTSEQQLAEQHAIAESKLKAGVLTKADLLRLEVAEANARQQAIQAESQAKVARSALLIAMGFPAQGANVELVEPVKLEQAAPATIQDAEAQDAAASNRHEVKRAEHEARAAGHQEKSKLFSLLPEANLEAAYAHVNGQALAEPNSVFVGLKVSWPVWEWGAGWYGYRSASQSAAAARALAEEQARNVRIEASTKLAQVQAAASAVEVAQATIASAEEAYRVTDALVKAGAATTTDLLDAQGALTQAKLNLVRARYQQAIAGVALNHATGG